MGHHRSSACIGAVEFTAEVRSQVPAVIRKASLRGADLIHLATAVMLRARDIPVQILSADKRMCSAAEDIGISWMPIPS